MGGHAEGGVTIGPRGLNGCAQRMREIQSRIDALTPKPRQVQDVRPNPRPFDKTLNDVIRPVNPMAGDALASVDRAPSDLLLKIKSAAQNAGIDPALFEALVGRESSFRIDAVSGAGASGLAQLMPRTAESLGVTDIFDPSQNLNAGARYLAQMLRDQKGNVEMALAAYNAGPGTVRQVGGIPGESQDYVRDVLARAAAIRQATLLENRQ